MTWRTVIMVPHEYVIEYARDVPTAQAGAEAIRAKFPNVVSATGMTYYPKILECSGPPEIVEEYIKSVAPKTPPTPELTVDRPEPPSEPPAA